MTPILSGSRRLTLCTALILAVAFVLTATRALAGQGSLPVAIFTSASVETDLGQSLPNSAPPGFAVIKYVTTTCGDGTCNAPGEDCGNCPADCLCPPGAVLAEPGAKHSPPASPCDCEKCEPEDWLAIDPAHLRLCGRPDDPADLESQWYFYRQRYLDPVTGRFTRRDPIGPWGDDAGLGNAYTYVGNGPLSAVDPYGLEKWVLKAQTAQPNERESGPDSGPIGGDGGVFDKGETGTGDVYAFDDSVMIGSWKIKPTADGGSAEVTNLYKHDPGGWGAAPVEHKVGLAWTARYWCNQDGTITGGQSGPRPNPKSTNGYAYATMLVTHSDQGKGQRQSGVQFSVWIQTGVLVGEPPVSSVNRPSKIGRDADDATALGIELDTTKAIEVGGTSFTKNHREGSHDWFIGCVCRD